MKTKFKQVLFPRNYYITITTTTAFTVTTVTTTAVTVLLPLSTTPSTTTIRQDHYIAGYFESPGGH